MSTFAVAHLRVQGVDFIFIPLSTEMSALPAVEQSAILGQLRDVCRSASLGGEVVPLWRTPSGGLSFLADNRYQPVLARSLKLDFIRTNLNKRLSSPNMSARLAQLTADPFGSPSAAAPAATHARAPAAPAPAAPSSNTGDRRSMPAVHGQARRSTPNRVVTMLFSDLVGSTKLKQIHGDAHSMNIIRQHHSAVRELLARTTTGEEVSTSGDSFFIVFAVPSEAVMFALKWQDLIRNMAEDEGVAIEDRIGIHVGEVYADEAKVAGKEFDFNGIQVDTAARVMSLAQGNQILMTQFPFYNAQQMLEGFEIDGIGDLTWKHHGQYEVKGVKEPLDIFEVGETGLACLRPPPDSEKAKRAARQHRG